MKCDNCGGEMVISDLYNRGRREIEVYTCFNCMTTSIKKGRKLRNNISKGTMSKGCSVPWGKGKRARLLKKRKGRRKNE